MLKVDDAKKKIVIAGGFDPIHSGHIALIKEAAKYGEVHIILNSDNFLAKKKGFFFQTWSDRKNILEAYTPYIYEVNDSDSTVIEALRQIRPNYFGFGSDNTTENVKELAVCADLNIEPIFGLGGAKYNSSSAVNGRQHVITRWGSYDVLLDMPELKVKILKISPGKKLSLQKHQKRSEFFFMPNGEVRMNLPGVWHAPRAPEEKELTILEVQMGVSEENDIDRIAEDTSEYEQEIKNKIQLNL